MGSINAGDVGHRVVVRRRVGMTDGREQYSDVLGELRSLTDEVAVVRKSDGTEVRVPVGDVVTGKRVPPRPIRRDTRRSGMPGDVELERIAALGWPGTETAEEGGWLLRAGGGFTGRANSALPLAAEPELAVLRTWYAARGLPVVVHVPLPARADLYAALTERGWQDTYGAIVLTAATADLLATAPARDLPAVTVETAPGADWLSLYHYRGGDLPAAAVPVLTAGAEPRFVTLRLDGRAVAICRTATTEGWLGLTAVEVDPAYRRRGLATHLLRQVAEATPARSVYLQTESDNTAALALYERAGFTRHHEYRYLRAPD
jgi:N-acetylglutamate synthase